VTVRRISLEGGRQERRRSAVTKEIRVGLVNGMAIGGSVATLALVVTREPLLALVVLVAMWGTVLMGGFTGAWVPTTLHRRGIDPAVASSVFVTTLTDMFGFFILLGLATVLLL
jgi:magnesium transporter